MITVCFLVLIFFFQKKYSFDFNTEPNMATMLSYVLTDLNVPKATLEKCLKKAVKGSFNTISVDGDQSTSDTVLIMSSQIINYQDSDEAEFEKALQDVCTGLAEDIVRNGELFMRILKSFMRNLNK